MKLTAVLLYCAGLFLLHIPAASAENMDPAIFSDGSGCANSWCASVNFNATDPISGDTGLVEFILKTSAQGGADPSVVTGDVDMSDGYVLRFEMSGETPEIFVINDTDNLLAPYNTGANPLPETAGAPNHFSPVWTPTAGQVGYDVLTSPPPNQGYGFELVTAAPEPASFILLSAGLGLLGFGVRKRTRRD